MCILTLIFFNPEQLIDVTVEDLGMCSGNQVLNPFPLAFTIVCCMCTKDFSVIFYRNSINLERIITLLLQLGD